MLKFTISDWIQIGTSFSIIVGLVLVVYEIQQTRNLVYTQMVQATYTEFSQEQSAIYGENGARALARACLKPNELTDEDSYIIDTMFNTKLTRVARIKAQETAGGYDSGWEIMSANVIDTILGFPQGEA